MKTLDCAKNSQLLSPANSTSSSSSTSSVISLTSNTGFVSTSTFPLLSDEELASLSVRQLNNRLQGEDRQLVNFLKQKRRTLKNRGYALNCRVRRIQNQLQLEADNLLLRDQIRQLRLTIETLQSRLMYYESSSSQSSLLNPTHSAICPLLPPSSSERYIAQLPYSMLSQSSVSNSAASTLSMCDT